MPNLVLSSIAAMEFGFLINFLRSISVMVSPFITINDLSLKSNMDEKEERHKQPFQESVRHSHEEGNNEL